MAEGPTARPLFNLFELFEHHPFLGVDLWVLVSMWRNVASTTPVVPFARFVEKFNLGQMLRAVSHADKGIQAFVVCYIFVLGYINPTEWRSILPEYIREPDPAFGRSITFFDKATHEHAKKTYCWIEAGCKNILEHFGGIDSFLQMEETQMVNFFAALFDAHPLIITQTMLPKCARWINFPAIFTNPECAGFALLARKYFVHACTTMMLDILTEVNIIDNGNLRERSKVHAIENMCKKWYGAVRNRVRDYSTIGAADIRDLPVHMYGYNAPPARNILPADNHRSRRMADRIGQLL